MEFQESRIGILTFVRVSESTPEVQNVRQKIYRRAKDFIWSVKKEKETVNPAWRVSRQKECVTLFFVPNYAQEARKK